MFAGGPRVFALPAGADFAGSLIDGLAQRMSGLDPFARAGVELRLNTRRAQRSLQQRMERDGRFAGLLPRIGGVEDLLTGFATARAVDPLRRKLHVARLVRGLVEARPDLAPRMAVFDLTDRLLDLLDLMQEEGVPPERLLDAEVGDASRHWQLSLEFLKLVVEAWPAILAEVEPGHVDPQVACHAAVTELEAAWSAAPPEHPVIIAGSTGSRPWMRRLMAAVLRLPQGAVLLPGHDPDLPEAFWAEDGVAASPDHPQAGLARLLLDLDVEPADLGQWVATDRNTARGRLISLALRPAPVTASWLEEAPARAAELAESTAGLGLIEAATEREEALAIACAMRSAVEEGRSVALVTPDRTLSRRVGAALDHWRLIPDDSAGRPLHLVPPGIAMRLMMDMIGDPPDPAALVALLKHPLIGGAGETRRLHLRRVIGLQTGCKTLATPEVVWQRLEDWARERKNDEGAQAWMAWLRAALDPLARIGADAEPSVVLATLRSVATTLSAGVDGGAPSFWLEETGAALEQVFLQMEQASDAMAGLTRDDLMRLLDAEMRAAMVRPAAFLPHPGVAILGALEARMLRADVTILAGLNEGIWPERPAPDPWLSRGMRRTLGLPMPERETGLAAHDVQNAANAPEVILSRAARTDGSPSVASRWLIRLTNLIGGMGDPGKQALDDMRARGAAHLRAAAALDRPSHDWPRAPRPAPRPKAARIAKLGATGVETLIRDPYAIYARYILGLRRLDQPGREADALERGDVLHKVMERFVPAMHAGEEPREALETAAREVLSARVPWPSTRALWHARLMRIADPLIEGEVERLEHAAPVAYEIEGGRDIPALGFRLTAKADRIDRGAKGLRIYDYKTGKPPTQPEVENFALQLPLEAAIARDGGFASLGVQAVERLAYIGLDSAATVRIIDEGADSLADVWARLEALLSRHYFGEVGYPARMRPKFIKYPSDYDHLSRYGEWTDEAEPVRMKVGSWD
ncbi:double-strand break repair protein AddB [Roseobacter sp. HKCCA0434]|uniref:double-strand break repair protein AddB n=1 Tax=Roseobacter sp. HKCCA0434 TaxID=3079297 RepID=UPI0029058603|nr:double-strand break repair protein AddB [Roseobacter sp. HKCCA0434]